MFTFPVGLLAPSGGAPWTPAAITTTRWLDPGDTTTLFNATSGGSLPVADGAVLRIEDKSGNARHCTQSTSGAAAIRKTSALGGLDAIRFDGSNDIYTNTGGAYASRWAIALCRFDQATHKNFAGLYTGTISQLILGSSSGNVITGSGYTVRVNGAAGTAFSFQQYFIWFVDIGAANEAFNNGEKHLGSEFNQNAGRFWPGELCELVEGVGSISTATIELLEGYLAHRRDITSVLPSGHPYKTNPPTL